MRTIAIFSVVLFALLLYAISVKSYMDTPFTFFFGAVAAGLIGYALSDYFFRQRIGRVRSELHAAKEKNITLAQKMDETVATEAIEDAADNQVIHDLRARMSELENERNVAQSKAMQLTAEVSGLGERYQKLLSDHDKFKEENTTNISISATESAALQDALSNAKNKLAALAAENEALNKQVETFRAEAQVVKMADLTPAAPSAPAPVAAPDSTLKSSQNGLSIAEKLVASSFSPQTDNEVLTTTSHSVYGSPDNLTVIEGIGSKIGALLKENGVGTWHDLAATSITRLRDILETAGGGFKMHNPETWPEQAQLLVSNEFDKFRELTHSLRSGKRNQNNDEIDI
ncbi:MAG: hypothetical protein RL757_2224 [Bacteroidota bacterium]|jgi:predicted flap endonuclease-1-like 5' DNA nuclease